MLGEFHVSRGHVRRGLHVVYKFIFMWVFTCVTKKTTSIHISMYVTYADPVKHFLQKNCSNALIYIGLQGSKKRRI